MQRSSTEPSPAYLEGFIGPRLAPMERPGAGLASIEEFFAGHAGAFRDGLRHAFTGALARETDTACSRLENRLNRLDIGHKLPRWTPTGTHLPGG